MYALIIGKQVSTNAHKKMKRNKKLTLLGYMRHRNDGVIDIQNNERCVFLYPLLCFFEIGDFVFRGKAKTLYIVIRRLLKPFSKYKDIFLHNAHFGVEFLLLLVYFVVAVGIL